MGFGVRMGPFRVGVSGRGRVTGGVTAGPFSASSSLGGGRPQPHPDAQVVRGGDVDEAIAAAIAQGCRLLSRGQQGATVGTRWRRWHIRQVRGGVQIDPMAGPVHLLVGLAIALVLVSPCLWYAFFG